MQHILGLVRRCVEDYNMIEAGETVVVIKRSDFGLVVERADA